MKNRRSNVVVARVDVFAEIRLAMSLAAVCSRVEGQRTTVLQTLEGPFPWS